MVRLRVLAFYLPLFFGCGENDPDDPLVETPPAGAVVLKVESIFTSGTKVRDAYTGTETEVRANGEVWIVPGATKVVLLERADTSAVAPSFTWDNATVYFAITDRFENGNTANDQSYGRTAAAGQTAGTWHGGDFAGLASRLDYLSALGVNALWISFPVEQIHGWVGGGTGDFQHFAYHGYWPLDFTRIDQNYGTIDELKALIAAAHDRGIRVVFDVVMNHAGYAALDDLETLLPSALKPGYENWTPGPGQNWHGFNDLIEFGSFDWVQWWGRDWIRSDSFPNHYPPGSDVFTQQVAFLPDFRTENMDDVSAPPLFMRKSDTSVVDIPGFTVREYLVKWLADWVRELGVDGFRADTAKHVEFASWKLLKDEATAALREWKQTNPSEKLDDLDFWMTGEVFPHGVVKDDYFSNGFDSLINFDYQRDAKVVANDMAKLEELYAEYAAAVNPDPAFNVLSYISSHDTYLYFDQNSENQQLQLDTGTSFMLVPGAVQIFYGDESGRPAGEAVSDVQAKARSDMNWDGLDNTILDHWKKLGVFRKNHPAVAAGTHTQLTYDGGYAFARELGDDKVIVVRAR
jgi:alpha-amylase